MSRVIVRKKNCAKMAERFFKLADNLHQKIYDNEKDKNYDEMMEQLTLEFSLLLEDFRLIPEEQMQTEATKELKLNAKHVYFKVGLSLAERALKFDIQAGPLENQEQMQINNEVHSNTMTEQSRSVAENELNTNLVDPNNASALLTNAQSNNEEVEMNLQMNYRDFVQLIKPIFSFEGIRNASARSFGMLIDRIKEVRERARELSYSLENDERALVVFIHGILDETSQEIWSWEVIERVNMNPTLDEMICFLNKRMQRMHQSIPNKPREQEDWDAPSTSYGISNPPKKPKKGPSCNKCNKIGHNLCQCKEFRAFSIPAKANFVRERQLCINCFSNFHHVDACPEGPCIRCAPIKHNSLLCSKNPLNY